LNRALEIDGFVVVDGPFPASQLPRLSAAYDRAMREAVPPELSVGRTTTRAHGFARRSSEFDDVHACGPILDACRHVIGERITLSSFLGRTLHAGAVAQGLHVDCAPDDRGFPMIGFIVMVDGFRADNGATLFVPGSHRSEEPPAAHDAIPACGPAGSVIIYNGSIWHGHGGNRTDCGRRSLQGAYVRS